MNTSNVVKECRMTLKDKLAVDAMIIDELDDGYRLLVWSDNYSSRPFIDRRNLLNKDRTWSTDSLEHLIYELILYEMGDPRTQIPQGVFDCLDLKFSRLA